MNHAPTPDQHERQRGQDGMPDDAGGEGKALPVDVHLGAAADRKHRPKEAENDEKDEGDDVVGDRLQAHGQDAQGLEQGVLAVVAGETAEKIADRPGDQRRADEQADASMAAPAR